MLLLHLSVVECLVCLNMGFLGFGMHLANR